MEGTGDGEQNRADSIASSMAGKASRGAWGHFANRNTIEDLATQTPLSGIGRMKSGLPGLAINSLGPFATLASQFMNTNIPSYAIPQDFWNEVVNTIAPPKGMGSTFYGNKANYQRLGLDEVQAQYWEDHINNIDPLNWSTTVDLTKKAAEVEPHVMDLATVTEKKGAGFPMDDWWHPGTLAALLSGKNIIGPKPYEPPRPRVRPSEKQKELMGISRHMGWASQFGGGSDADVEADIAAAGSGHGLVA